MKYIRTMTQQRLSFWLALHIGWFINIAVFFRRFSGYAQEFTFWKGLSDVIGLAATVFATFFLLRLLSLLGRRIWHIPTTLIVLFSATASYYMASLNVVANYGAITSMVTTDIDLSKEVIDWHLILWLVVVNAPPLLFIWNNRCRHTLLRQLRTPGQRVKNVLIVVLAGLIVWDPICLLRLRRRDVERHSEVDMPSYDGVIVNPHLPSNWLSALGLYTWTQVDKSSDSKSLINPAKKFTYIAPEGLDDTHAVPIIGETTRWNHMGILGYSRDTTPELEKEKNPVTSRDYSCDIATKLSLRCIFVRQGGAEGNPQRTLREQNVFAVLHRLGFNGNLHAMQSEIWFYSNTMASSIAYREQIGAELHNRGKSVDDMLLVDEMRRDMAQGSTSGGHLVILHTKGFHFSYTQRYPRSFAQWKSGCVGVNNKCSKTELISSYNSSATYVNRLIVSVLDQLQDKKTAVFYTADHGESINEREHLHGTLHKVAPPRQFRVPMMVWTSDKYLESPDYAAMLAHLQQQVTVKVLRRHVELYDTIMGCLGYTSPDGRTNESNNWYRWKK